MKLSAYFSLKRFYYLLRRDLFSNYRVLLVAMAATAAVLLVASIIAYLSNGTENFHLTFYSMILIIGGFIISSTVFSELHNGQRSYVYLTLPGSIFEKYVEKLLLTSLVYVIGSVIFYFAFSLLASGVNLMVFGRGTALFNPFNIEILENIGRYLVLQSLFLFGAVYFKKQAFIKTVSSVFGLIIALSFFGFLMVRLVYWDYFSGVRDFPSYDFSASFTFNDFVNSWGSFFENLVIVLFWGITAPFFWILGFLRLRETEV